MIHSVLHLCVEFARFEITHCNNYNLVCEFCTYSLHSFEKDGLREILLDKSTSSNFLKIRNVDTYEILI